MVQRRNNIPTSPKAASRLRRPVDQALQPDFFKALSDPTRLKLLACLAKCGRACLVREVAECCDVDLSVVSRHLATLERAGILESSKEGRDVSYRVRFEELVALFRNIADAMEQCCPAGSTCGEAEGGCCGSEGGCCG
jgi:ArsR family transcriptional regulator